MKLSDTITDDFFKGILDNNISMDVCGWLTAYDILSSMVSEAFIILDFKRKNIQYISNNDMIMCDHTNEMSTTFCFDFFEKVIHPKDILFCHSIIDAILDSPNNDELLVDQVNYFSFLLRIKNSLSSNRKSDYIMTYVKLKPLWSNDKLQYGICILSVSVIRKQEHQLCVHYKNMDHSSYSIKTKKWKHYEFSPLSKRQKEMLVWAQQGLSLKETADKMHVTDKTIESIRWTLFDKFGVKTIEQAIQYASNRRLIFNSPSVLSKSAPKVIK
ncbi:helix-turn-helix domain-containing protein [Macellibacteroides fermentans]|uniref:helix-turn-helix domain-containing protein n=1 Tax=Macellibacteroides fermentans TaxID=879969 RepID=UPI00406C6647